MIRGIGIDLAEIERIQKAIEKEHFKARVFTETERRYADAKGFPAESYAGIFAAKEAALKAFGTGLGGADLSEIEVRHDASGRPVLHLYGRAEACLASCGAKRAYVSISHTRTHAVAQVILED